jgi:hypothetical protein
MNKALKIIAFSMILFAFALTVSQFAAASIGYGDPYSGVNCVGCRYQYTNTVVYNRQITYGQAYDYIAPPRGGGWFGTGTEWLVGLRSPQYTMIPPVHYTNYYQPVCGWPCWTGGDGYPRAHASDFNYRERPGGIFSY